MQQIIFCFNFFTSIIVEKFSENFNQSVSFTNIATLFDIYFLCFWSTFKIKFVLTRKKFNEIQISLAIIFHSLMRCFSINLTFKSILLLASQNDLGLNYILKSENFFGMEWWEQLKNFFFNFRSLSLSNCLNFKTLNGLRIIANKEILLISIFP